MSAITDAQWRDLLHTRAAQPDAVATAYGARRRPDGLLSAAGTIFLVAADHGARGMLGTGGDLMAMADRRSLLNATTRNTNAAASAASPAINKLK